MRKVYFLLLTILWTTISQSQNVTVSGAVAGNGSYPTLADAFTAINGGTQTGAVIQVTIDNNTSEPAGGATLNAGAWTSMSIQPSGGAARTIVGAATAGSPLINFNGADNVTIDGLNTGGNSLTIENTTVSSTSGTSTIRFIGGATGNTITRCFLKGAGTTSVATNGAIVFFSTDGNTANGNDNNTISNCDIGPSGANLPSKAILGNGSTTTTAIGNSGIVITNNDIHDIFAVAVTSSAIATNGGCNSWTITNNRIYQTAARTWTTGAYHKGIEIAPVTSTSGAQGFTITGNTIGYASNSQTGTYTLTGSTGKFQGIFFNGITGGTVSTINNNTIASISLTGVTSSGTTTTSPFSAIFISNGNVITNNNIIGSQTTTGSLTFSTNTTTGTDVYGILNFGSDAWTSNGNQVGSVSLANAGATGAFIFYGIRGWTGSGVTWTANGNNVGGTIAGSIQSSSTSTTGQVIGINTNAAASTLTGNTVRNLTTAGGTGTTTASSVIGISSTGTSANQAISQNTIHTLSNSNTSAATAVVGLQFNGSTANVVDGNLIYGLSSATNSATAEISGIRVAGGTTVFRNNIIAIGAGVSNAIGATAANASTSGIAGINEAAGLNSFYNNSVYIGGSATAGTGASFAFNGTQVTSTRSFRNNIFFNGRANAGATGKHYAIKINGTAANPAGLTLNNNVYYQNGSGGAFGFFNSLDVADLNAWKTAVGQDANSFFSNPEFIAPASAIPDLHIHPTNLTLIEGNGVDLGVTTDFDGQTRSGLTPVDIGADAGNFTGVDLAPPSIVYTPVAPTSCTPAPVTLIATITDAGNGVPTSGLGLPVLYWRINAGTYTSLTGTSLGSGQYQFTFGAGAVAGDVVSYYIVAQDNAGAPNVTSFPAGGAGGYTANPPAAATPPTTPSSYTLPFALSGTYNVGTGQTYTTLTAAVNAYNTSCLNGPVVFQLMNTTYTAGETFPITINNNTFASATNTLTIRPAAGVAATISGSNANTIIKLNGADYVTIDGLNTGGSSLTIVNTNTTGLAELWIGSTSASDGALNNSILNTSFSGTSNSGNVGGIISGSAVTLGNPAESPNNNLVIRGCRFIRQQNGIYVAGNATTPDQGIIIANNTFGSTVAADKLTFRGLSVQNVQGVVINNNTIAGVSTTTSSTSTATGISVFGVISGGSIYNNKISDIRQPNTLGYGSNGIGLFSSSTAANLNVYNNFVSDVASQGFAGVTSQDNGYGIMVGAGGGYNIDYNTVLMNTNQSAAGSITSAINFETGLVGPFNLRNNIFVNKQTVGTNRYAILSSSANTIFTNIDHNDYFSGGANLGFIGSDRTNLAAVQAGFGSNANSINVDPVFISATDLHLNTSSNAGIDAKGTAIAGLSTDIDGDTRNATTPDIGADEFEAPCTGAVGGTAAGTNLTGCGSATPAITASGYSEGAGSTYQWQSSNDNFVSNIVNIIGQTNPAALTVGTVTSTTYYRLLVTCPTGTATAFSNTITVTINIQPAAFTVGGGGTFCSNQTAPSVTLSGSETGVNYQLYAGVTPVGSAVAGTGSPLNFGPQTTSGVYTVVAADAASGTCTTTMTGSVTVTSNPAPVLSGSVVEPTTCVSTNGSINLTVSGAAPGPYTYNWSTANGSGLVNGQEDQAGLTVGTYTVTVSSTSGCSETTSFTLLGPGGCSVCPTIGAVTTNAGSGICEGASVTVTASGLTGMSNIYGITFKYSTTSLADPYTGGTVFGTVANGSLTGGGTTAAFTGTIPTPGSYYIYAILSPTPLDPSCRPASQTNLLIAPTTSVDPVTNLVVCNNANTPVIPFTSSVAGTTFSWTNNNTSIGLAASGTGNIASFLATNAGTAPVTATVTVTPSKATPNNTSLSFAYTGAMQTWTVPAGVTSITIDAYGAGGGTGASGNSSAGATLGGPGGRGSRASGTLAVTPGQVLNIFVGGAGGVSTGGYNGGGTGGNSTSGGGGGASDIRYPGTTSGDRLLVAGGGGGGGRGGCESANTINGGAGGHGDANGANGTDAPTSGGVAGAGGGGIGAAGGAAGVGCGGFLGQPGLAGTGAGIGGAGGAGQACCCFTFGSVPGGGGGGGGYFGGGGGGGGSAGTPGCSGNDKGAGGGGAGGTSYTGGVTTGSTASGVQTGDGLVVITYNLGNVVCTGTPTTFTITVNPTPTVNAVASQTVCNGASTTAVNFSGAVPGTVYNWTNNTTSIGLGASGTGNIAAFNAVNTGSAPVTATITVTPSYTNGATTCTGTPTIFTITVNPTPTVNAVANQTVCNGANTAAINFSGAVAGTVYNWTNNTTSIGLGASGTGNIAAFPATNTGTTPVTATITVTPSYTNAGTTCTGTPITFTITVNPSAAISVQPANTAACAGQSAAFSVTATGVSLTYQWQVNSGSGFTNLANVSPYSGVTTPTLTINPAALALNGNTYRVVVSSTCGTATSNAATLTANPLPTISVAPSGQCSPVTLTATGNSNTYSWSPALGLNTTTGATVIATTNTTLTYTVTGTITATGCTNTATATVLGTPPPVVVTPANPTICAGTIQQLTVPGGGAIVTSSGTITIPFGAPGTTTGPANPYPSSITVVGLPTSGVTVKSVTINGVTHAFPDDLDILLQSPTGQNVVLMSDVGGSNAITNVNYTFDDAASSLMSDAGLNAAGTYRPTNFVTPDTWAAPGPGSINQPTPTLSSFTGNPNGNWGLYIVDDATGNVGSIANWSITFNVPTATWTPVTGLFLDPAGLIPYTAGTLVNTVYANPANTTTYTVTGTMGSCSVPSGTVTVTVNPKPTISVTPNNQCGPVTLTASGTGNTYSWSPAAGLSATTGATVTANPQFNTTYTVTSTITATGCTNTATVTVNATPAAPTITPSAVTICRGATTTLTAASQPIVVSSTCGTITVPAGAPTTTNGVASPYPCSINVSGFPALGNVVVKSVTLNGVTHAFPDDLDILLQAPNGQNVILMSDVGGNNAITNVNYVFDDAGALMSDAGANPAGTYRPTNIGTGDAWAAPGPGTFNQTTPRLSDFAGNFNGDWKLFVVDDAANNVGSITSWSITFQRLDGAIWTPVTGLFTNPTATVPYVAGTYASTVYAAPTTTTTYSATVGSASSSCVSAATTAVVTVLQPVTITTQPASQTVCVGANATFSVVAAGSLPSYQWQLSTDGGTTWNNIANANGASFVATNTTAAMSGYRYRVIISNTCSSVTSSAAILTVNTLTTVTVGQLPASICLSDAPITLTGSPVGGSWSGIGVSGNTFVPAATAVGTYTLTYTYANPSGCNGTATVVARVVDCQDRNILLRDGAVQLYPNPNNGQFNLRIVSTLYNRLGMDVYNSKGQLVRTQQFSGLVYGRVLPVDLTDLPSAVYMVKLYYDDGVRTSEKTFKVIVAK